MPIDLVGAVSCLDGIDVEQLTLKANAAMTLVVMKNRSELREVWAEAGVQDFGKWKVEVEELLSRLDYAKHSGLWTRK